MYDHVKEQLHHSFDPIAPDLLSDIQAAETIRIDDEEMLFANPKRRHSAIRSLGTVAAVFVLMITGIFCARSQVVATMSIEANTTINLSVNRSNKMVHVSIYNPSPDTVPELMAAETLEGKDLKTGLDEIIQAMDQEEKGPEKAPVKVNYHSLHKHEKAKKVVKDAVQALEQKPEYEVEANIQSVTPPQESEEEMSTGEEAMTSEQTPETIEEEATNTEQVSETIEEEATNTEQISETIEEEAASTEQTPEAIE